MTSTVSAASASERRVRASRRENVLVLELHHAERRNALSRPMLGELLDQFHQVDPYETAGVVLTGVGDCFSAGANFGELTGTAADIDFDDLLGAVSKAIADSTVPIIGVVSGPCIGAACELLLACDVSVAEPSAVFHVPAVKLGLLYSPEAIAGLSRKLPDQTVRRLLVLADRFTAPEAAAAGLVSMVQPSGSGVDWAVERLVASWDPDAPEARTATKALLRDLVGGSCDLAAWQETRRKLAGSDARLQRLTQAKARHKS